MAEKTKKRLSRRAQERLNHQLRSFDLVMLGLALTTAAAAAVCSFGTVDLGKSSAAGFAYWFLVVQSYLPLGLISGFRTLFRISPAAAAPGPWMLAVADIVWCAVLWAVLRILGKRNNKSQLLHVSTRLALVVLVWGWFQLLCAVIAAGVHAESPRPESSAAPAAPAAPAVPPRG